MTRPPSSDERCEASSTATTVRTDAAVTASGSPRRRWSATLRWKANRRSGATGNDVDVSP